MKNKQPLVSIITPSYNQGQFLEETIRSVLLQDYPSIEYIIVDGKSTDNSLEIINRYKKDLAWFVSEKDSGQSDAINKGLKQSSGEIVAWLNSDDIYTEQAISRAVDVMMANPECGMVYSDVLSIDKDSMVFNTMLYDDWGLRELMLFNIIGQPGVFMRREVLEKVGQLEKDYHFLMDHHLWLRIASEFPVMHIEDFWAAARFHESAKNISQAANFGNDAFRILDWMKNEKRLMDLYHQNQNKIKSGAYNVKARYLLDSEMYLESFRNYTIASIYDPIIIFREFKRIIYALVSSMLPIKKIRSRFINERTEKIKNKKLDRLIRYLK